LVQCAAFGNTLCFFAMFLRIEGGHAMLHWAGSKTFVVD
jgi:hypothetical protein